MRIVNIRLTRTDKEELNMEKIIFQSDDGTAAEFYVEEQTNIAGVTYLLVSDSQDEEADAYILKDISAPGSTEACYEMVEDDDELLGYDQDHEGEHCQADVSCASGTEEGTLGRASVESILLCSNCE